MLETIPMMGADEARQTLDGIKKDLHHARALLLDLYRREGWRALGYESFRACVTEEFGKGQSQLYRELRAAEVELNISPLGENDWLPERHARELAFLPPELQALIYEQAKQLGKVTAEGIRLLVMKMMEGLSAEKRAELIRRMEDQALAGGEEKEKKETNFVRMIDWIYTKPAKLEPLKEDCPAVAVILAALESIPPETFIAAKREVKEYRERHAV